MTLNSSASLYGARGRGAKASVASPEGLRNMLRNETERDSAPALVAAQAAPPAAAAAAPAPAARADDKQTLRGLNDRLSGFLARVKQLQEENEYLERQIDEILSKRKTPEGRDWDKVEKPLEDLKQRLKDITMDNARLLIEMDNTLMANNDLKHKLEDEKRAQEVLLNDLESIKKITEEMNLKCDQTVREIDMVKDEVERLEQDHKIVRLHTNTYTNTPSKEVDILREKIRDSEVKVEIESKMSDLSQHIKKIRAQYDKLAERNLKETEEWYKAKFENIKVVEAQNTEALQSGQTELKDLMKQKQTLTMKIQSLNSMIQNLEEVLKNIKMEYGHNLAPFNQVILRLEGELRKIRSQVELQAATNKDLVSIKMKLQAEINDYQKLIHGQIADSDR
ncbi:Keratin, type I cytoskeletal 18 Cytokeratin-18 [Channa argus]|uniref:Keratin, type I cytoskeletal 18 Cytokeratin-18 n=1 Tax=Channa argus TaxID=215402 RepID=A0A6G1PEQ7_CHAAH|nr:Keratin, type I cytoskeletal 18 Cytokeratin-18 [Channa argus]